MVGALPDTVDSQDEVKHGPDQAEELDKGKPKNCGAGVSLVERAWLEAVMAMGRLKASKKLPMRCEFFGYGNGR